MQRGQIACEEFLAKNIRSRDPATRPSKQLLGRVLAPFAFLRLHRQETFLAIYVLAAYLTHPPLSVLFFVLLIGGMSIRLWAAAVLVKRQELTNSGPYAYTRNPLYLGTFFMGLAITLESSRLWLVAVYGLAYFLTYYHQIRHEQQVLGQIHGDRYEAYRSAVPVLFPWGRRFPDPDPAHYSLHNILRNKGFQTLAGACIYVLYVEGVIRLQVLHLALP